MAHKTGALATRDLERVVVDTIVQPKAIAHPTDARLCHRALQKLVELARRHGVPLRQSYRRLAKRAAIMVGRYSPAHQFKGARRAPKFSGHPIGPGDPRHPPQDRRRPGATGALCRSAGAGPAGARSGPSPALSRPPIPRRAPRLVLDPGDGLRLNLAQRSIQKRANIRIPRSRHRKAPPPRSHPRGQPRRQ